ncbi:MAG: hypothetical protein M3Y13_07450 [Armatimonadota bacterium]|nr:hypothetical protein [Armatimonadota bacterium]
MPNVSSMIPTSDLQGQAVIELARRAEQFLAGHRWCKSISERYLAWALAPQTGVFFFRLIPAYKGVDKELWVIIGDLPPAYIVCDKAQSWQEALDAYGVEMMKWVEAVRNGRSITKLIPVNAEPTSEYANMLETRIKLIWKLIVDVPPETLPSDT